MAQQQRIRVVVERKGGCQSGCGTNLAVMLLIGLTIRYWYVALSIVALVVLAVIANGRTQPCQRPAPGAWDLAIRG